MNVNWGFWVGNWHWFFTKTAATEAPLIITQKNLIPILTQTLPPSSLAPRLSHRRGVGRGLRRERQVLKSKLFPFYFSSFISYFSCYKNESFSRNLLLRFLIKPAASFFLWWTIIYHSLSDRSCRFLLVQITELNRVYSPPSKAV